MWPGINIIESREDLLVRSFRIIIIFQVKGSGCWKSVELKIYSKLAQDTGTLLASWLVVDDDPHSGFLLLASRGAFNEKITQTVVVGLVSWLKAYVGTYKAWVE